MGNLISIIFMNNDCNMMIDIMPICFVADSPSVSNGRNTYSHKRSFLELENSNFTSELFIFDTSSFFKLPVTTLGMKNSVYLIRHNIIVISVLTSRASYCNLLMKLPFLMLTLLPYRFCFRYLLLQSFCFQQVKPL